MFKKITLSLKAFVCATLFIAGICVAFAGTESEHYEYILTVSSTHKAVPKNVIIKVSSLLNENYEGDCEWSNHSSKYELCYIEIKNKTIHIALDPLWNDSGRHLNGVVENESAIGEIVLESYGPWETIGSFQLDRKK